MAKATAKIACGKCGCEVTLTKICHSRREADSWESYIENRHDHICEDCRARLRAEESARAAEEARAKGLPEMSGTPRQVAWAESIRKTIYHRVESILDEIVTRAATASIRAEVGDEMCAHARAYVDIVRKSMTRASFWIDNRNGCSSIWADFEAYLRSKTPKTSN